MATKEYGCSCCKVIFTSPESSAAEGKGEAKCPYCQSSEVQNLDNPNDKYDFVRRISRIRFG